MTLQNHEQKLKIYKSSAGSGKTTILVYEYLRLILHDPGKFDNILAITFTNKASNEMKERIVEYLESIIDPGSGNKTLPSPMLKQLEAELKDKNLNIKTQANKCLNKILHSYTDFAVSTIDSFVYRIIRTFAPDLGLSWDFDVEMDTEVIFTEIINMLMEDFGNDHVITKQITQLIESKLNEEKSWKIEKELLELSHKLLESESQESHILNIINTDIEKINNSRKSLYAENEKLLEQAKTIAGKAIKLIEENNLDINDFASGKIGIGNYFYKIAYSEPEAVFRGNQNAQNAVEKKALYKKQIPESIKNSINSITDELINYYNELQKLAEHKHLYYGRKAVFRNLFILSILKIIKEHYEKIKEDNQLLPISEFSKSISSITMSEDIPYIYERIGEKYRHFFIDEFQDTSTLQWENMLPLVENSLSQNNFNLIVGDVKQAIYRFRGGNIDQLGKMPLPPSNIQNEFSLARYETIRDHAEQVTLNINYRSRDEIVDFNNRFFEYIRSQLKEPYQNYFSELKQHTPEGKDNSGGQVKIYLRENREEHLSATLEFIQELQGDGYDFQDIAILCRTNKEAQEIAIHLIAAEIVNKQTNRNENIPVISDESLTLKQSTDVNALISFARIVENPENKIELANILYFIYLRQNTYTDFSQWFTELTEKYGTDIFHILQKLGYSHEIKNVRQYDLYNFFESLAFHIGCDSINNPYLQYFLDEVLDFSTKNIVPTLQEFLDWWNEKGKDKSVRPPENQNAVKIKTIHKSKGLDFPVVIYPLANDKAKKNNPKDYKWVDTSPLGIKRPSSAVINANSSDLKESVFKDTYEQECNAKILDLVNTLYVCMTRPVERLYIISYRKNNPDFTDLSGIFTLYFDNQNITENELIFPKNQTPKPKGKDGEPFVDAGHFSYNPLHKWSEKLYIKKPRTINLIPGSEAKYRGNLLHFYLSLIKHKEDLDATIQKINNQVQDAELAGEVIQNLKNIINHPGLSDYFHYRDNQIIKTEPEILTAEGILRPDRVNLLPGKITIIEYKTGTPHPKHENQVKDYVNKVKSIYAGEAEAILVYTNPEIQVKEVI